MSRTAPTVRTKKLPLQRQYRDIIDRRIRKQRRSENNSTYCRYDDATTTTAGTYQLGHEQQRRELHRDLHTLRDGANEQAGARSHEAEQCNREHQHEKVALKSTQPAHLKLFFCINFSLLLEFRIISWKTTQDS